jgi:DNA mismatch endonuclease, patch repair protein
MIVRKGLYGRGFRYRLHDPKLPGKPDLVIRKYNAVIFVHGCFWHMHGCKLFRWPSTREEFWRTKIHRNAENDVRAFDHLSVLDWRVAIVWECALKGPARMHFEQVMDQLASWLLSDARHLEVFGTG